MSPLLERKLRFSDAVYAIDTTPKSLRKWLQNEDVVLFTEEEESNGWREFSFGDLAVLAIMRKLVDYGCTVSVANALAARVLAFFPQLFQYQKTPPGALVAVWTNRSLLVWRDGEGLRTELRDNWKAESAPSDAYIVINMEAVLRRAFDRATESRSDGEPSDGDYLTPEPETPEQEAPERDAPYPDQDRY